MNAFFHRFRRPIALAMLLAFILPLVLPAAAQSRGEYYGSFFPKDAQYQTDWRPFNDGRFSEITSFACVLSDGSTLSGAQQQAITDIMVIGGKIFAGQLEVGDFQGASINTEPPSDASDSFDNPYDRSVWQSIADGAINSVTGVIPGGSPATGATLTAIGFSPTGVIADTPEEAVKKDYEENKDRDEKYYNLGYATGQKGLRDYLNDVKRNLQRGKWAGSEDSYVRPNHPNFKPYVEMQPDSGALTIDTGEDGKRALAPKKQATLAKMIQTDAGAPLTAFKTGEGGKGENVLPSGCALTPFSKTVDASPGFTDMIDDLGGSVMNLLLYLPSVVINGFYDWISPLAFKFSFWTPHTERGDLFWTVTDTCDSTDRQATFVNNRDGCKGDQALGYSRKNLDVSKQGDGAGGAIIKLSSFIKWLLSGTYFLILFAAAAVFIVRGNAMRNFHLLRMLPWLLASIVLALLLPYILGAVISFSNTLVGAFFGQRATGSVARIGLMFTQTGILFGGAEFFQRVINLAVGGFASYYMIILTIVNLLRQVALIFIVVVAPIAAFSIITPTWRSFFVRWVKAFLVVVFLPVVFALILRIGMGINPLIINPEAAYGTLAGFLGILLMLAVLFLMTKVARSSKDFVLGQSNMATGAVSGAGAGIANTLGQKDGAVGAIGRAIGGSMQAQAANAQNQSGSMIPKGRAASAGILTVGNLRNAWKEHRSEDPIEEAKRGRQAIDAGNYQRFLAEQSALGEGAEGAQAMYEKHGFWVEERNGKYYRNFQDPNKGEGAAGNKHRRRRQSKNNQAYDQYVAAGAAGGGGNPSTGASSAAGGPKVETYTPPGATRRPSSPSAPTPTTGTPQVPETGGRAANGTPPSVSPANGSGPNSGAGPRMPSPRGSGSGSTPGIGPMDKDGPTV